METKCKRKRILYIFSSYDYGGSELLTEALINNNLQAVEPVVLCPDGPFKERLEKHGYNVCRLESLKKLNRSESKKKNTFLFIVKFVVSSIFSSFWILLYLKNKSIKIVQANNANAASKILISVILTKTILKPFFWNLKWVCARHEAKYISKIDKVFNWFCLNTFDCIICVSKHVVSEMEKHCLRKDKIKLVYNGIDYSKFSFNTNKRSIYRERFNYKDDEIIIALVGRVSIEKGAHLIYETFCRLASESKYSKCKLMLIGSLQTGIESVFNNLSSNYPLDIKKRIILLDKTAEISSLYSAFDIVVNTSLVKSGESFGLSIAEAMACKRIALAVKVGGLIEIIEHGKDGFLCEPENIENLLDSLRDIINNFDKLDYIRENAYKKISENFSMQLMIKKYNVIYNSLFQLKMFNVPV